MLSGQKKRGGIFSGLSGGEIAYTYRITKKGLSITRSMV